METVKSGSGIKIVLALLVASVIVVAGIIGVLPFAVHGQLWHEFR